MTPSRRHIQLWLLGALAVYTVFIWSALFPSPKQVLQQAAFMTSSKSRVAALLAAVPASSTLPSVEKNSDCTVNGALPDPACTPGEIFYDATPSMICVPGYTKQVRSVSTKLKKQIYTAYGMDYPPPTGTYELDHLVPLALGGDNSPANLFPEARDPAPGFKQKDVVEVYLYQEMCAGHISLAAAQIQIAKDWLAVYQTLEPSEITDIQAKYRSWSN